eukprot:TRINITY_DN80091_c0_g1_i1.p1 TRINITY_DN80091_c0_g1~~TRINITY_DN80091_c0_g1_i1.p1  ORF type:complete len:318 (-),score=38.51 TRINITY_DN80091_c0_g1_i1:252-1205(-)
MKRRSLSSRLKSSNAVLALSKREFQPLRSLTLGLSITAALLTLASRLEFTSTALVISTLRPSKSCLWSTGERSSHNLLSNSRTLKLASRSGRPSTVGMYAEGDGESQRESWDLGRAVQTAAYFDALPNPVNMFRGNRDANVAIRPGQTLWSAENPEELQWGSLDDVVMGGASRSSIEGNVWTGTVITQGGGFAGIRTKAFEPAYDVSRCIGLKLRLKGGGGQRFKFIIRDSYDWNGIAWSYAFETKTLLPGQTVEVSAPFEMFVPTLYARRVPSAEFNRKLLTAMQITLSKFEYDGSLNPNFQAGDFSVTLESIETY